MQASLPVRFHAYGDLFAGISIPCSYIKWIGQDKEGKTVVLLMDAEEIYVSEKQLEATQLWEAAVVRTAAAWSGTASAGGGTNVVVGT